MTMKYGGPQGRRRGWLLIALALFLGVPGEARATEDNKIQSITAVDSEIEIVLTSSKEFAVRDALITLRIGDREFTRSRAPDDGSLNTIIFVVDAEEFASAGAGDQMRVYYQPEETSEVWNFGPLDKSLLRK